MKKVFVKRLFIIASLFAMLALVNTTGGASATHQQTASSTLVIEQVG